LGDVFQDSPVDVWKCRWYWTVYFNAFSILTKHLIMHRGCNFCCFRCDYKTSTNWFFLLYNSWIQDWFFFFLMVLEFELRALCLWGRFSITWAISLTLFCFSYLLDRVLCFCLWLAMNPIPLPKPPMELGL
jgi:hypothetical protein